MNNALAIIGAVLLLWIFIKIFKKPIKWIFKLFLNAIVGFAALFLLNFLGGFVGLHITVGWLSAIITGVLGIPGIILLLLIENLML